MTGTLTLAQLKAADVLAPLDEQLALQVCALVDECDERVRVAIALLSRQLSHGHVCLPITSLAQGALGVADGELEGPGAWPDSADWLAALRQSPLCGDQLGQPTPLVLDGAGRLYLRRHYERERELAAQIAVRASRRRTLDTGWLARRLSHYFGDDPDDLQRAAAALALTHGLCVISGGPGTGKTSTVVKILALIVESALACAEPVPRIALVAPTGKAAVRLESAVLGQKNRLACEQRVREHIPHAATTIHRALLARPRTSQGRADLNVDVLLVDEASMVDLELMAELFGALPGAARVILLGDQHQLSSVEAGAVLGDISGAGLDAEQRRASDLASSIVVLKRSYRYAADSGIGALARAVQSGDAAQALSILRDPALPDVRLEAPVSHASHAVRSPYAGLSPALAAAVVEGYGAYLRERSDPVAALRAFDAFRVLCAHRRGDQGVTALNRSIVRLLFERGLIERGDGHFDGRPLLITANDYRNQLWNGDVGLVRRSESGLAVACFVSSDGQLRELGLGRLPVYEDAFAISVHKSQGSEMDEIALVLPHEVSRVLTRELLYTAVTRARKRVVIHASEAIVAHAIGQRVARHTGLRDLLY